MRLASFSIDGTAARPGLVVNDGIIDIGRHLPDAPADLVSLISRWSDHEPDVAGLTDRTADYPIEAICLHAPITRPGKIFALGLNYRDHCAEANLPIPVNQSWFTKALTSLAGPYDDIELPHVSEQFDYEAELVVVIGRRARNVPSNRVSEVVFGYCVGNDLSVRDWQLLTQQHTLGKSFDKAAPVGPWITTADAVDVTDLGIRCFVNDEPRQNSSTRNFVFSVADMIVRLSQAMTLEPGDLLFTGTPAGVGLLSKNGKTFLREGDEVRVEIDGLGAICNTVKRGPSGTIIE